MITPGRYDMPITYSANTYGPFYLTFDLDISQLVFELSLTSGADEIAKITGGNGLSIVNVNTLQVGPFSTPAPTPSQADIRYELRGNGECYLIGRLPVVLDPSP